MRSLMCVGLVAALGAGFHVVPTSADDENHVYKAQEPVVVWVQSVYPYHNPSEVYRERDLFPPVSSAAAGLGGCPGDRLSTSPPVRPPHLGELLLGSELENSELDVQFKVPVEKVKVCSFKLDEEAAKVLAFAVSNHYLASYLVVSTSTTSRTPCATSTSTGWPSVTAANVASRALANEAASCRERR